MRCKEMRWSSNYTYEVPEINKKKHKMILSADEIALITAYRNKTIEVMLVNKNNVEVLK